jgi:methylmalonyl-CoA/ethylmalonyl-CoA epimerase
MADRTGPPHEATADETMAPPRLDHVALVVPDLAVPSRKLELEGLAPGPITEFPAEGTRERYLGQEGVDGRVLLLQPITEGPYLRALRRRGPGLHHLALAVTDVDRAVAGLSGSGWYLHPRSLATMAASRTVWLCRPDAATLVELMEATLPRAPRPVATQITLPSCVTRPRLYSALGCPEVDEGPGDEAVLHLGEASARIGELVRI